MTPNLPCHSHRKVDQECYGEKWTQYYDHLLATSQKGDLTPWIDFFLSGVRQQARDAEDQQARDAEDQQARDAEERTVRLVELQSSLRGDLLDEGRPSSVIRLAEYLFAVPIVTASRVEQLLGVTRPTAQAANPEGNPIEETARLAANVLLWEAEGVNHRLETTGDLQSSLAVVDTLEPHP